MTEFVYETIELIILDIYQIIGRIIPYENIEEKSCDETLQKNSKSCH